MSRVESITGKAKIEFSVKRNSPLTGMPDDGPEWDKLEAETAEQVEGYFPYETYDLEVTDLDDDGFTVALYIEVEGTIETWLSTNPREYPDESEITWETPDEEALRKELNGMMTALDVTLKKIEVTDPEEYNEI